MAGSDALELEARPMHEHGSELADFAVRALELTHDSPRRHRHAERVFVPPGASPPAARGLHPLGEVFPPRTGLRLQARLARDLMGRGELPVRRRS